MEELFTGEETSLSCSLTVNAKDTTSSRQPAPKGPEGKKKDEHRKKNLVKNAQKKEEEKRVVPSPPFLGLDQRTNEHIMPQTAYARDYNNPGK